MISRPFKILIALLAAITVSPVSGVGAQSSTMAYPVGTRLSLAVEPETVFEISAEGPSVLWVTVSAPALARVTLETEDAGIVVTAREKTVEAAIPVFRSGKVTCRVLSARSGGRVLVSTSYGIGAEVTMPEMVEAMSLAVSKPVETPVEPPVFEEVVEYTEPIAASVAAPTAALEEEEEEEEPEEMTTAPEEQTAHTELIAPHLMPIKLFFGAATPGALPMTDIPTVQSYRVYIPNRTPFRLSVTGPVDVRLQSMNGVEDHSLFDDTAMKTLAVSAPTDDFYIISVRGSGEYALKVEKL